MRCSLCNKTLCLDHFFDEYHSHEPDHEKEIDIDRESLVTSLLVFFKVLSI